MEIFITTLVIFTLGAALHFLHSVPHSGKRNVIDILSATNESTWEHMKLLITSIFVFTLVMIASYPEMLTDFVVGSAIGLVISTIAMPILFYAYLFLLQKDHLLLDILLFLICSFIFALLFNIFSIKDETYNIFIVWISLIIWIGVALITIRWTYNPPKNELFRCPERNIYGHSHRKSKK